MFRPSARVLKNRVDIYRATNAQDLDGAYTPAYSLVKRSVPCTVQNDTTGTLIDDTTAHRLTETNDFLVIFAVNPNVRPRDKIVWVDDAGATRTLFVDGSENCAGRSAAWAVKASERQ